MKKRIKTAAIKCSVVIPIATIIYMFYCPVTICIADLDVYLSYRIVICSYVVLTILWLTYSPIRSCCCNGKWTEPLFNLIPICILSLFLFAQWHLKITGLLLAVYIIAVLFTLWNFSSDVKLAENKAEKKKCLIAFKRLSVLVFAAICAFPCAAIITVYGWESPVYEPDQNSVSVVNNDNAITDIYQENLELIKCFSNEAWSLFSLDERITLLQSLESLEAEVLGIPSVEVLSALLDESTLASYDNESNQIWIDIRVLSESTADTCIEGICHETFHAYQYYVISCIDWESELSQSLYFQDARSWMENSQNYISSYSSSYDSYAEQPLESAAHAYAEDESQTILSYLTQ